MSLFQHSVLNKYLKEANQDQIKEAYERLKEYFHNPVIQQNIRESKEEQFQEGFLTELFVKVLGYTINPNPDYNLTTEYKNERGAKKADGAILKDGAAIGVIELKSTKTKELEAIRLQAFDYKANQQKCIYVITSNFEKVRFYINNAVDFEEFDLFRLEYEHFRLMWLCLAKENLLKGIPLEIKEASLLKEERVTKQIYVDYSLFKSELYNDLTANNLDLEIFTGKDEKEIKLTLFKKSQKLLDRFLFIFFGEDRGLLPPNSISEILQQWEKLKELDEYRPLYERYKKYFSYLNKGWKGKKYEIFAYNGGLFTPDEVLDNIVISDEVLRKHTKVLTAYDFETEVDVNILGHIFENSLNEIEEKTAQIEGETVDLKKSKRKKDGVYYTPKYITKYIVENTVGKLCDEKRNELDLKENEYLKSRKGRTTKKLKELDEKLELYRKWLLTLTICDPACGSGAFLNQALDFLIREHRYIDELRAKMLDVPMVLTEIENSILEKNIYGVDINEESVEIAKLSLWLRTAQKGRKLTTLSSNIKCGNSLIDDPEIAGEKAFNWHNEFPEVFKNGGFDVVIGNPPYVRAENINKNERNYYLSKNSKFKYTHGRFDLYILFNELGISVLKKNGLMSFIFPSSFFNQNYSVKQRNWLIEELDLMDIVDLSEIDVFKGVAVETGIILVKKDSSSKVVTISKPKNESEFLTGNKVTLNKSVFKELPNTTFRTDLNNTIVKLINKIKNGSELMNEFCYVVIGAVPHHSKTGASKERLIKFQKENDRCKKYIEGKNVKRYLINWDNKYLDYQPNEMHRPKFPEMFENDKLLIRNISTTEGLMCVYDDLNFYCNDTMSVAVPWYKLKGVEQRGVIGNDKQIKLSKQNSLKYILAIINSNLINYYFKLILSSNLHVYPEAIRNLPIKSLDAERQLPFILAVEKIINSKSELFSIQKRFGSMFKSKFGIEKLTQKLEYWYNNSFNVFIKELKKNKVSLSLSEESEWMQYFEEQKQKARSLKFEIEKTDREIDQMVYELYDLTDEEIKIVEESV